MQQLGSAMRRPTARKTGFTETDRMARGGRAQGRVADGPLRETSSLDMVGADALPAPGAAIANALAIQSRGGTTPGGTSLRVEHLRGR